MDWKKLLFVGITLPLLTVAACADESGGSTTSSATAGSSNVNEGGSDDSSSAGPGTGGADPSPADPTPDPNCPHDGPPVIDPAAFPACPSYVCGGGAHCVPKAAVPGDVSDFLADCNKDSFCVPDIMIETNGNFLLDTCTAVLGVEGRCLSKCIPLVADRSDFLEQDTCADTDLCVPCFDPISGDSTSVCELTCDAPVEPPPAELPSCCPNGNGTCLPNDVVPPASAGSLAQDACPESNQLCVPNEMLAPEGYDAEPCQPDAILQFLGIDDGGCLPSCVEAVQNIGQGSCPSGFKCAPCDVFGEATGACGDDW